MGNQHAEETLCSAGLNRSEGEDGNIRIRILGLDLPERAVLQDPIIMEKEQDPDGLLLPPGPVERRRVKPVALAGPGRDACLWSQVPDRAGLVVVTKLLARYVFVGNHEATFSGQNSPPEPAAPLAVIMLIPELPEGITCLVVLRPCKPDKVTNGATPHEIALISLSIRMQRERMSLVQRQQQVEALLSGTAALERIA